MLAKQAGRVQAAQVEACGQLSMHGDSCGRWRCLRCPKLSPATMRTKAAMARVLLAPAAVASGSRLALRYFPAGVPMAVSVMSTAMIVMTTWIQKPASLPASLAATLLPPLQPRRWLPPLLRPLPERAVELVQCLHFASAATA